MNRRAFLLILASSVPAIAQIAIVPNLVSLPQRVSFAADGSQLIGVTTFGRISNDGNLCLFLTGAPNVGLNPPVGNQRNLYLRHIDTGALEFIASNVGPQPNRQVQMSADGDVICFVAGVENAGLTGFPMGFASGFLYIRSTQTLQFLTHTSQGTPIPTSAISVFDISDDGRYVLLRTDAANLAGLNNPSFSQILRYDRFLDIYEPVALDPTGQPVAATSEFARISGNGRFVAFASTLTNLVPNDTNNAGDIFIRDMTSTNIERVSVGTGGVQSAVQSVHPGGVSPDGRFVLFVSSNSSLDPASVGAGPTYYVRDRLTNTTRALPPNQFGISPGTLNGTLSYGQMGLISPSNRVIITTSDYSPTPTNGLPFGQIWMCDLEDGDPVLLSRNANGVPADLESSDPVLSANGRHVVFVTDATNLDPSDTNYGGTPFLGRDVYKVDFDCFIDDDVIGVGKPGSAGITPLIFATSASCASATTIAIAGGLGGAQAYLGVGFAPAAPTVIAGSPIYFDLGQPSLIGPIPNFGIPGIPGAGTFIGSVDLSTLSGLSIVFQSFFVDPFAQGGFSSSPGLQISVY
jgi:hypothetical protein